MNIRRIIFSLFSCTLAFHATAQTAMIKKEASFDFHNYHTLTPQVVFERGFSTYTVKDIVFTSKEVSFEAKNSDVGYWTVINKHIKPDYCGMQFPSYARLNITVPDGCYLDSVDFKSLGFYNAMGGIVVSKPASCGTYRFGAWGAYYYDNQLDKIVRVSDLQSIEFYNANGQDAVFSGVKVFYYAPAEVLNYLTMSPAQDEVTDPFTGYTFTFAQNVTVAQGAVFEVKDATEAVVATLTATVNGKTLTLTPDEPIVTPGQYTMHVAAGSIKNADGEYNPAFDTSFSVFDHPDTFNMLAMSVDTCKMKELPAQIVLTFPAQIGSLSTTTLDLKDAALQSAKQATLAIDPQNDNQLVITFDENITVTGRYSLLLPQGLVTATDGYHYNKEVKLQYQVTGYDVPTQALMDHALELLAKEGVGYPKTTAAARTTLAEVTAAGDDRSQQDYENALAAYLASTDIVYPQFGRYYLLAAFSDAQRTDTTYLAHDATQQVYVVQGADEAEHFLVVDHEGDRALQTSDGTLFAATFAKAVNDSDPESVFGLLTVSIEGYGDPQSAQDYLFLPTLAREPELHPVIAPVSGTETDVLTQITVSIPEVESLTLDASKPISLLLDGAPLEGAVTGAAVEGNLLTLTVSVTRDGLYTLSIPEGALTYHWKDHDALVPALTATYDISKSKYGLQYDLFNYYWVFSEPEVNETFDVEFMNNVYIWAEDTELFINPDFCQTHVYDANYRELYKGTLERVQRPAALGQGTMLRFKFDTVFDDETLPHGDYYFTIDEGSFGDQQFGDWLQNRDPAGKRFCHLNSELPLYYQVTTWATAIRDINIKSVTAPVYDLSGRRVSQPTKHGIYVKGGRKYVK